MGTLDHTPAPLRRVWSMAVYAGRLYGGTLPSGHVLSLGAGKMVSWDQHLPHGLAPRRGRQGGGAAQAVRRRAAPSPSPRRSYPGDYDLSNERPLRIGAGPHEHFDGLMSDVRVYRRALEDREIGRLVEAPGAAAGGGAPP